GVEPRFAQQLDVLESGLDASGNFGGRPREICDARHSPSIAGRRPQPVCSNATTSRYVRTGAVPAKLPALGNFLCIPIARPRVKSKHSSSSQLSTQWASRMLLDVASREQS